MSLNKVSCLIFFLENFLHLKHLKNECEGKASLDSKYVATKTRKDMGVLLYRLGDYYADARGIVTPKFVTFFPHIGNSKYISDNGTKNKIS